MQEASCPLLPSFLHPATSSVLFVLPCRTPTCSQIVSCHCCTPQLLSRVPEQLCEVNFLDFVVNLRFWTFLNSKQSPPPPPPLVPSPCRSSLRWIRRGVWLTSVMRWSPDRSWPSAAPPALSSTPNWNATRTRRPGVFWDSGQPVWGQWFLFLTLLRINLQLEHPNKCLIYSLRYISTWKLLF